MNGTLDERASAIVAEMADLGAVFAISDIGPTGDERWHWEPRPEVMRNAIRKVWSSAEGRHATGFNAAIINAIRRHQGGSDVR